MLEKGQAMFMVVWIWYTSPAILEMPWLLPSHSPFLRMNLQVLPESVRKPLGFNKNWNLKQRKNSYKAVVITCPATANPSARREVANQTCKHTWNAAIDFDPSLAAIDAERVIQNVTAITLINNRKPESKHKQWGIGDGNLINSTYEKFFLNWKQC